MPCRFAILLLWSAVLVPAEVVLRSPLVAVVPAAGAVPAGDRVVLAVLRVPEGAPADLGAGAWLADRHGRWWQRTLGQSLRPGRQRLRLEFRADQPVAGEHAGAWSPAASAECVRGGLMLWSASASRVAVTVESLVIQALDPPPPAGYRLADLIPDPPGRCGERWQLAFRPDPYPSDPYDPETFRCDLVVIGPDGDEIRLPAFHHQPLRLEEGGDRELALPAGRAGFLVRFRPRLPGVHRLRLEARWRSGVRVEAGLPPLTVSGQAWDGYLRTDADDPRFLSAGGAFVWPNGPNLRSVSDVRGRERMGSRPTPERGSLAYRSYLDRLAAAGGTGAEVWMSGWNLALEWRGDWPGYHGAGRYNQANAARLDALLDRAWERGIRIALVLNNHGQASEEVDREWQDNPWNRIRGGPLAKPVELFTDPRALAGQERLRRYLVGRYAEHPALLCWKLWTEIDLTDAGRRLGNDETILKGWHEQAVARWRALDPYRHPLATHWANDYQQAQLYRGICALPGLDLLTVDAYHQDGVRGGRLLAQLLYASTARRGGLHQYGKPVLVTEYGGWWDGCPPAQMEAEHASAAFCALVSGHAGGPMLWWSEWLDQGDRYQPYRALAGFLVGEDLRSRPGSPASSAQLEVRREGTVVWGRAWVRPGRLLGYLCDERWHAEGRPGEAVAATVQVAATAAAGSLQVEWWDADLGRRLTEERLDHPGGALSLRTPAFRSHLAFKLMRRETDASQPTLWPQPSSEPAVTSH